MKLLTRATTLFALVCATATMALSQTIWSEDFTYPDGTVAGPAGKWVSACGGCLAGDFFEVRSNSFRASDVNDWSVWESQVITTTGCNITFSLTASETGDHEGAGCACGINQDYFDVYYSLSGGSYTVIQNWNGDGEAGHTLTGDSQNGSFTDLDWGSTTVTQGGLLGSTLQLRVEMRNTAGDETLILDNIVVDCGPLPVATINLQAKEKDGQVEVSWETAMESGSDHFLVERSANGTTFFSIGRVAAAGNSDRVIGYQYTDRNPIAGRSYYRLRQVDLDGGYSITPVVEVLGQTREMTFTELYPNPASERLHLKIQSLSDGSGFVQLLDMTGRQVGLQDIDFQAGPNAIQLNTSALAAGIYVVRVRKGSEVLSRKFQVR